MHRAEQELLVINAKMSHFKDLMVAIGAHTGPMIGKPSGGSKTETAAVGLVFLTGQMEVKIHEYTALIQKADEYISQIQSDKFRKILTLKYICDWSWRSIQDELGYKDEKSVYACHRYALRELQKLLPDEEGTNG